MNCEFAPEIKVHRTFDLIKRKVERPISNIPVLIIPGFGASGEAYRLLMEQLNSNGFDVMTFTYRYGRPGEPKKWLFVPDVDKLKQQAILEAIREYSIQQGIKQFNVVAHSKGAMDVAWVAIKYPEYFRNIAMIAPGGLRPEPKAIDIIGRIKGLTTLIEGERRDEMDKTSLITQGDVNIAKIINANNIYAARYRKDKLRRISEGITPGIKYIRKLLPELRKKGIKIAIICQKSDPMYPPQLFDKFVRGNVDYFVEIPGIHGELKFNPKIGQLAADLLTKMEADRSSSA